MGRISRPKASRSSTSQLVAAYCLAEKAILEALCFRSVRPSVNVRACVPGSGIFRPDSRRLLVIFFISNINNHIYTALYFVTSEALNFDFGNPMYTFERFGHVVVQMTSR